MRDILKVMPGTLEFDFELLKKEKNERVKYLVKSITKKEATLKKLEAEFELLKKEKNKRVKYLVRSITEATLKATLKEATLKELEADFELLKKEKNERVKYLVRSITEMEVTLRELECVVCLETGSFPLYCCQEQHLVCSTCRPGVRRTGKCPSCRAPYPGGDLLRHRFAERTAERLGDLRQELANLRTELDENLS